MAGGDGLIPALSDPPSSANPDVAAAADVAGAIELRDLKAEILDLLAQLKFAHGSLPRASPPAAPAVSSPEVRNDSSDSPVISAVPSLLPLHASVASSLPNSVAPSTQHPVSPSPPPIVVQSHDIPRFSGADGLSTMRWLTAFARITQTPLTSTSPLSDAVQCILTTALKGYALETYLDLSEDASMADVASALLHDFPEPSLKRVEADFDNLKQTSSVVHHSREFQRLYKKVQQLDPLYRLSPSRLAEKFRMSLHPALSDALFIYNYTEYDKMFEMAIHLEPKYPIAAVNAIEVGGAQPLVCHYCREAGHFIASCPKRPPCQHCHKVGHRSALCPERPAAAGPPPPPPSASVPQAGPPGNVPGRLGTGSPVAQ